MGSGVEDAREIKNHEFFKEIDWDDVYNKKYPMPAPELKKMKLN